MKEPKKFKEDVQEVIKICEKVLKKNLTSIILFGSVAKGTFNEKSDYDFLIVVKKYPKNDAEVGGAINYMSLDRISMPLDVVFIEKSGLDDITSAFSLEVQANGKVIYGENCLDRNIFKRFDIKPLIFGGRQIGWRLPS